MSKLPKDIKDTILTIMEDSYLQVFNTKNIVGDMMCTIYNKNGITIDYCREYDYLEIFGLNLNEYEEFHPESSYWIIIKEELKCQEKTVECLNC